MSKEKILKEQLQIMIHKAGRSINAARIQVEGGDYDFASSRAYFGAFYAIEAVLLTKNLTFSKHSGVIGSFNQHFIKKEIFPKDFSKLIARLSRERHIGDYDFDLNISEEEAKEDIKNAERIVQAIANYLIKEKFMDEDKNPLSV